MIKPNNYEAVSTGDFTPVLPGGHHLVIKQVKEQKTKTGKDMLVVLVEFATEDRQPMYMSKMFEADIRPDKKWPRAGVIYVVSVDSQGQCSRNFKTFITSVERSNNFTVKWDDGPAFVNQFVGKRVGGVYGRVESEYNGERKMRCEHRWFCEDSKVDGVKVPEDKLLPQSNPAVPAGYTEINTEEIPF